MKTTTLLILLFACVMVSAAKKPWLCKKKMEKIEAQEKKLEAEAKCEETVSQCKENCTAAVQQDCVITSSKEKNKNKCMIVRTEDISECAQGSNGSITITVQYSCKMKKNKMKESTTTKQRPCEKRADGEAVAFKKKKWELMCSDNKCRYEKKVECGENATTVALKKLFGTDDCPETLDMPCSLAKSSKKQAKKENKQNKKKDRKLKKKIDKKMRRKNKKQQRKAAKAKKDCKFRKGDWSECNLTTGKRTMKRVLKRGDPNKCEPFKMDERPCRKKDKKSVCKYRRTSWSDCDGLTNVKRMVMTLKRGKPGHCDNTKVKEKICKRKHRGLRASGCKYNRGTWSACDLKTGKQTMRKPVKPGSQPMCPQDKLVQRQCKKKSRKRADTCKYRKNGRWSPCDAENNTKTRNMVLVRGNPMACPPKKVLTKSCRQRSKKGGKCRYDKSQWGPCDAATNTVTRTLTLKGGDHNLCNTTRIDVRKCKDKHLRPHVCKYRRTTWGECDPTTSLKKMAKTLKRGDPSLCEPTEIIEKKCKKKNKGTVCKYKFEPWSPCVNATNTMTRYQVLESGPSTCPLVKEYSKKCKKPCNFHHGEWSPCDPVSKQMTRMDILKPGSADFCNTTRVLSKKCGKREKRCTYDFGTWSECDESDKPKRSRIQTLLAGGENCDQRKIVRKPCKKPNGEDRCFFGQWQEFRPCQNGVMKKHRQVLQGGLECEKKGVKMKSC